MWWEGRASEEMEDFIHRTGRFNTKCFLFRMNIISCNPLVRGRILRLLGRGVGGKKQFLGSRCPGWWGWVI